MEDQRDQNIDPTLDITGDAQIDNLGDSFVREVHKAGEEESFLSRVIGGEKEKVEETVTADSSVPDITDLAKGNYQDATNVDERISLILGAEEDMKTVDSPEVARQLQEFIKWAEERLNLNDAQLLANERQKQK